MALKTLKCSVPNEIEVVFLSANNLKESRLFRTGAEIQVVLMHFFIISQHKWETESQRKYICPRRHDPELLHISSAQTIQLSFGSLPAMRETWVQSLGWEDALEKVKANHSSILAWRIP